MCLAQGPQRSEARTRGLSVLYRSEIIGMDFSTGLLYIWAKTRENLSSGFANNKGIDHVISAFVLGLVESMISKFATLAKF